MQLAQVDLAPTGEFGNLNTLTIENVITWAVTAILVIAAILFFFMLIIGGIRWILSGGDKAGTESARNQITAAIVGLIIVFAAWAIATLVGNIFGVNILGGLDFGTIGG